MTEIGGAANLDSLNNIILAYMSMGYSRESLVAIAQNRIAALTPKNEPIGTQVPTNPTIKEMEDQRKANNRIKGTVNAIK